MRKFTWVSGRLTEVQRFINVPMRWCEQYPARERRELWMTTGEGVDIKLVVHTRVMPARCGHQVLAVLHAEQLMGLHNLSTGESANFVRVDSPLLWRRCDGVMLILLAVCAVAACLADWLVTCGLVFLAALAFTPLAITWRWLARCALVRSVDCAIDSARQQATGQARLRRIK